MHSTTIRLHQFAEALRAEHVLCDQLGRLTDETRRLLIESGGMRLLQSRDSGGFEADPLDFFEWVRTVARYNPSAGWVAGVVGVHPWELALTDRRLNQEIYGASPDTWIASPYAPQGRAQPVVGGFLLTGEWQYSTGTDHCSWVVLGGMVTDAEGQGIGPNGVRHFFLPRADYEIVEDSWQVMGLSGTGSKNVRVAGVYVPDYRTLGHRDLAEGVYSQRRPEAPLYHLPFACVFSAAIASATFGIAQGAIDVYRDYLLTRVSATGVVGRTDPFQQESLAEAEADVAAGIVHVDTMIARWMEQIRQGEQEGEQKGEPITSAERLEFRRNQVRAVQRVLFAVDKLFSRAGSAAIWSTRPLERFWRDLRTAGTHICNTTDTIYPAWVNQALATGITSNAFH